MKVGLEDRRTEFIERTIELLTKNLFHHVLSSDRKSTAEGGYLVTFYLEKDIMNATKHMTSTAPFISVRISDRGYYFYASNLKWTPVYDPLYYNPEIMAFVVLIVAKYNEKKS